MLDRDQLSRILPIVTDLFLGAADMPLSTQPIAKFGGARNDRNVAIVFQLAYTVQAVANDPDLCLQLRRICHLLKIAAATKSNVRTRRLDPVRRRLYDRVNIRERDLSFYLAELDMKPVANHCKVDKHCQSFRESHSVTARNNFFDPHIKQIAGRICRLDSCFHLMPK